METHIKKIADITYMSEITQHLFINQANRQISAGLNSQALRYDLCQTSSSINHLLI